MSVKLNHPAYEHAKQLFKDDHAVVDDRSAWGEHKPSVRKEDEFIKQHGWGEYAKWHLGLDTREKEDSKERYQFPYGDFKDLHRCAVMAAEDHARERKLLEIESAAAHLHGMLDARR